MTLSLLKFNTCKEPKDIALDNFILLFMQKIFFFFDDDGKYIIANLFFYKIPLIVDHAKLMTHLFEN